MGHSHACAELKGIHFEKPLWWCAGSQPASSTKGVFQIERHSAFRPLHCTASSFYMYQKVFQIERHSLQMFCTACSQLVCVILSTIGLMESRSLTAHILSTIGLMESRSLTARSVRILLECFLVIFFIGIFDTKCCGIFLVTRYYFRFIAHVNECTIRPRPVVVDDLFIVCLPIMEEEIN